MHCREQRERTDGTESGGVKINAKCAYISVPRSLINAELKTCVKSLSLKNGVTLFVKTCARPPRPGEPGQRLCLLIAFPMPDGDALRLFGGLCCSVRTFVHYLADVAGPCRLLLP